MVTGTIGTGNTGLLSRGVTLAKALISSADVYFAVIVYVFRIGIAGNTRVIETMVISSTESLGAV